jgi:tryptophan synthase alpha chain
MNRIEKKFQELKTRNKKAFIAFLTCGYPDIATTRDLALEFAKKGVDILELGLPFSDPVADGPIIQESSQAALKNKINLRDILRLVRDLRRDTDMPLCLMSYYNPIFCFGQERFLKAAKRVGLDAVIIADLPPEEGQDLLKSARWQGLDVIYFVSPTTSFERIRFISKIASGFVYYISLTGTTGPREKLSRGLTSNLKRIKRMIKVPVCVGFGISGPEQVSRVYQVADGVIVGSAIIKKIRQNLGRKDLVRRVGNFVGSLIL